MDFEFRKFYKLSFSICCFVTVTFMIVYWYYKYAFEDRDIGVVDYVSFQEATEIEYPVVSLCFYNPFLQQKFKEINPYIDDTTYLQFLKGNIMGKVFVEIDYQNISLDINDYFSSAYELWFNKTRYSKSTLSFDHVTTFNGFQHGYFMKCFSISIKSKNYHFIKIILLGYNKQQLLSNWSYYDGPETLFGYNVHYPGQFLLGERIFSDYLNIFNEALLITEIEVLKRRSSHSKKCFKDDMTYDKRILNHHISRYECRPPYLSVEAPVPICNTTEMMKKTKFEIATIASLNYPQDCQILSHIKTERVELSLPEAFKTGNTLTLAIMFPRNIKIITLSKEVDIHTLIGNIGGYIGLFLGYALVQLPDVLFVIYDYIERYYTENKKEVKTSKIRSDKSSESNLAIHKIPSLCMNKSKKQLKSHFDVNESCKRNFTLFRSKGKVQGKYESSDKIKEVLLKVEEIDERFGQLNNTVEGIKRELSDLFLRK